MCCRRALVNTLSVFRCMSPMTSHCSTHTPLLALHLPSLRREPCFRENGERPAFCSPRIRSRDCQNWFWHLALWHSPGAQGWVASATSVSPQPMVRHLGAAQSPEHVPVPSVRTHGCSTGEPPDLLRQTSCTEKMATTRATATSIRMDA